MSGDSYTEVERERLRGLLGVIEAQLLNLPRPPAERIDGLLSAWTELVAVLALGPVVQERACPYCQQLGTHNATLCGYCWRRLPALATVVSGESITTMSFASAS